MSNDTYLDICQNCVRRAVALGAEWCDVSANNSGNPSRACLFQAAICEGCTSYKPASSLTVRSPRIASRATFAFNAAP